MAITLSPQAITLAVIRIKSEGGLYDPTYAHEPTSLRWAINTQWDMAYWGYKLAAQSLGEPSTIAHCEAFADGVFPRG